MSDSGERERTPNEYWMIAQKKAFAETLLKITHSNKVYLENLENLVHDVKLNYEDVVLVSLFAKNSDLNSILRDPIVSAFVGTDYFETKGNPEVFNRIKQSLKSDVSSKEKTIEFAEWLNGNLEFLADGLKEFTLYSKAIEPLSRLEGVEKSKSASRKWREQNPDIHKRNMQKLLAARVESAKPVIYTIEVVEIIQKLFNEGFTYDDAARKLKTDYGIETSRRKLISLVYSLKGELSYEAPRKRKAYMLELFRESVANFRKENSRQDTIERFLKLGFGRSEILYALQIAGRQERLDWEQTIPVGDDEYTLTELLKEHMKVKFDDLQTAHSDFVQLLKNLGLQMEVNYNAYISKRKRIEKSS